MDINKYIVDRVKVVGRNWAKIAQELQELGYDIKRTAVYMRAKRLELPAKEVTVIEQAEKIREKSDKKACESKIKSALDEINRLRDELEVYQATNRNVEPIVIQAHKRKETESTAFLVCSDWHVEQKIDPKTISYLNEFNPEIAKKRVAKLFNKTADFIKMFRQDTTIETLVVALLGDFINGNIHEELVETNYMSPIDAVMFAEDLIAGGVDCLLERTDVNLIIPCHSGNHPRITKKVHHSSEKGNSLETVIYCHLAKHYSKNERVTFRIADGYHSYIKVYDRTIRFHHGHDIKYGGGIGGLFIPAYKAISQWDKARTAELDVFGHFHQTKDGGKFICNGSLVGYDAFALSIKADYEPPKQSFFLYHEDLGRTVSAPIYL